MSNMMRQCTAWTNKAGLQTCGTYLAQRDGTKCMEVLDNLTFEDLLLSRAFSALECVNPTDVSHRRSKSFDMELILQCQRQPMQRSDEASRPLEMLVKLLGSFQCEIKANLQHVVGLEQSLSLAYDHGMVWFVRRARNIPADERRLHAC